MKQSEILDAQNSKTPSEKSKNTHLVKRTPLTGTPFVQIEKDGKHFLTIKNYKVTDEFETEQELNNYMVECMWDLIGRTSVTLYTIAKEIDEEIHQATNQNRLSEIIPDNKTIDPELLNID